MHLFHSTMLLTNSSWKLGDTAKYFSVSIGLVSENIKLAKQLDNRPELLKASNRQEALDMERRRYSRIKIEDDDE